MKKIINLITTTVLIISLLTGCSSKATKKSNYASSSKVNMSNLLYATEFSNGLAFIQYNDDEKSTYCIDKTGKKIFELEDCNLFNFAKFNDKIAIVETTSINEYVIYDKTGKMYNASDFGATRIVLDTDNHKSAFMDGYIILERSEESYTGTKVEMSIINSDFTTLVPFSTDLAEKINGDLMTVNGTMYYDGYLYFCDYNPILDLRTGILLSDTTQMNVAKPLLSYYSDGNYGSDFEHLEYGDIYNDLTGEVVGKVKEHETVSQISFVGDIGLATYSTDNGTWFNIIEQNGTAKFEPIKAESDFIRFDGETILVISDAGSVEKENGTFQTSCLKTYNVNGESLGELIAEGWKISGPSVTLNDNVIKISNDETYMFYNTSLEKLF